MRYKDYVDVCSKYIPTLEPHLSRHSMGIREDEQFWLEEREKSMRGNDKVTRPCGTTQIAWIHEISYRASETKSWERSSPPAAALISFAKKDGGLRLCVDYSSQ